MPDKEQHGGGYKINTHYGVEEQQVWLLLKFTLIVKYVEKLLDTLIYNNERHAHGQPNPLFARPAPTLCVGWVCIVIPYPLTLHMGWPPALVLRFMVFFY